MDTAPSPSPQRMIAVRVIDAPKAETQGRAKILLLKIGEQIGDFITAIDGFRIIRNAYPQAEITLICLPSIVALAESTSLFDRIVGFSYVQGVITSGKVPKMDIEDQAAAFAEILEGPYWLAADFRADGSTRFWLDQVETTYTAGFAGPTKRGLDVILPQMEWNVPVINIGQKNLPVPADLRLTLLAHAIVGSLCPLSSDSDLFVTDENKITDKCFDALKTTDRFKIGVSVGAGSELRKWPIAYWVELLQRLTATYNPLFVFFGSPGDRLETQEIMAQLQPDRCIDTTVTPPPLAQLPAYMKWLDAYIGCDTGQTHLAGKMGIPTLNIFAGTALVPVWRTRGPKVKTVYAEVICAPCGLRFKQDCPNKNICMTAIIPGIADDCFEKLLAR